jgi:cytochrome b6-f complex iron-sulfur subunit
MWLILGIVVVAVLAVVVMFASLRGRDSQTAFGQLSNEAIARDRSKFSPSEVGEGSSVIRTGKDVELAAKSERALATIGTQAPVVYVPPDEETIGVARRQFLNRGIVAMFGLGLSGFGAACIAFLWPTGASGFGATINVGKIGDIQNGIKAGGGFFYVPEGRMWITEYPKQALPKAADQYGFFDQVSDGLNAGIVALYQTCPHLGCRVPECATSQWFECPCHGSQYNRVGEKKGGPAPRGMDRFPMVVTAANDLLVNTGNVIQGPAIGTNTTGQEAEGPNCISGAEEH